MHFIKKVPTTEEQRTIQEKEKTLKAAAYKKLCDDINSKLKNGKLLFQKI